MFTQDYLTLRLIRLKPREEWEGKPEGFSFVFLRGGVAKYMAGTLTQRLGYGDVAVLNGTAPGKLHVWNGDEVVFWWFSLSVEHLFPLFAGEEISMLQNVADGLQAFKVYPASGSLAKECHRLLAEVPAQFNLDHRSQLLRVAASILTEEFKTARTNRAGFVRAEDHLIQVFEKLSTDELLSLSVGELANKFGCSRRHLNRLFHQHFGFSVASFRMEMRLLKAVSLLRNPDAKIINVADQCGFNHLGLFNTCFKRRFGVSPGQWRKQTEKDQNPAAGDACPLHMNGLCPWSGKHGSGTSAGSGITPHQKLSPTRLLATDGTDREKQQPAAGYLPKSNGDSLPNVVPVQF
jgi:AraC family mar-sox-rob regulon transcriptional activator